MITKASEFYDEYCWYPSVEPIVLGRFGHDIGNIILIYCKSFLLKEDQLKEENDEFTVILA